MERSTLVLLFGVLAVLCSFISIENQQDIRKRNGICWFFFFLIVVQSGFRDYFLYVEDATTAAGRDTANYYQFYNSLIGESLWSQICSFSLLADSYENRDLGYPIFVKLTHFISDDFRFFLILTSAIIAYPISRIVYKYSTSLSGAFIGMALYEALFAGFYDTALRQAIAMGFVYTAFLCVQENKSWKWWGTLLFVSLTIHTTSVIFIPMFLVYRIPNQNKLLIAVICIAPLVMIFAKPLVAIIGKGTIFESYAIDSGHDSGTPVFTMMVFAVAISLKVWSKRIVDSYHYYPVLISAIAISLMLTPASWVDSTFIRLVFYYLIFLLPLLSVLVDAICRDRGDLKPLMYTGLASVLFVLVN